MGKDVFYITCNSLLKLGIDPKEVIEYIENKKAVTINPAHVKIIQQLRRPTVSSS